jgi:hypothetical protein
MDESDYQDGSSLKVRDIIDFAVRAASPHENQTENWIFDPAFFWVKVGQATWAEVCSYAENPATLWNNGDSTQHGLNDQILHRVAADLTTSITMLHVDELELHVCVTGADFGNPKKRVQAWFTHRGESYQLWVTDPIIESHYLKKPTGSYAYGECCVTVSLSEPHAKVNGATYVYKLVAAIIPR